MALGWMALCFFLTIVLLHGPTLYLAEELDVEVFNRRFNFIFISGFPQSGTSLLQQMITASPPVSTMVGNCERVLGMKGNRCQRWNHEGQWLLRTPILSK
jgi:hypothetical protein